MPISHGGGRWWIVTTYHSTKVTLGLGSYRYDDQQWDHLIYRSSAPGAVSKAMGQLHTAKERRTLKNAAVRRATVEDLDMFSWDNNPSKRADAEANIREHAHEVK